MYDTAHILYVVISLLFIIVFSFIFRNVKENARINILRVIASLAFLTHISIILYDFFLNPSATISGHSSAIYPYYFCNLIMLLLPITFCGPKVLKKVYPFVLWAALYGGLITMAVPEFYHGGNIFNWGVMKSFLSHSFMIFAFVYAVFSGEYQLKIKDSYIFIVGLLISGAFGVFTNWLWEITGKGIGNSMYLNAPALEGTPFYGYVIAPMMIILLYGITFLVELLRKNKNKILTLK